MKRILFAFFIVAAVGLAGTRAAVESRGMRADGVGAAQTASPRGDTLWVANRDADSVTVVDAATGATVRTMAIGDGPHDLVVSPLTGKVYVMNELENRIAVVSASTLQVLRTLNAPGPHHADISADGRFVVVGLFGSNQVAVIDAVTDDMRIHASSTNPNVRAHAPHPSPSGRHIFVPHEIGNELTALDAVSGAIVGGVVAGAQPSEVLVAPDGLRLFVSMRGEGTVKVFNLATAQVMGTVSVGTQPESMILTPDQRRLIVSLRGSPATLAFVDAVSLQLLGTVPLAGAGTFGDLAVASPSGQIVYATFDAGAAGTGGVVAIDTQTGQKLATWMYPAPGRPHGIAYSTVRISAP